VDAVDKVDTVDTVDKVNTVDAVEFFSDYDVFWGTLFVNAFLSTESAN